MTKERATISIDSEVLEKARKQIPNISGFLEECLRQYLGIGNNILPTHRIHELEEIISKCQLELYLMNERGNIEEAQEKFKHEEINLAWRRLYTNYRDTKHIDPQLLSNAEKTLNVPAEELTDIVEVCLIFSRDDDIDVTEWSEVYQQYGGGK